MGIGKFFMIGWRKMVRMGTSVSFIKDLVMVNQARHSTPSVMTRTVPSPSLKQLMVKSLEGIPTLPGQAVVGTLRPTRPSCLQSRAVAFHLRAKWSWKVWVTNMQSSIIHRLAQYLVVATTCLCKDQMSIFFQEIPIIRGHFLTDSIPSKKLKCFN